MFYALIALCLFGGASAQLYGLWKCPDSVKPMMNFDPTKLKGRWFQMRRYPMTGTLLSRCPYADYKPAAAGHIKVIQAAYYANQRIILEFGGEAHAPIPGENGKLKTTYIWDGNVKDYWILSTDYNGHLVVYSCSSFWFLFHWKYVSIFTKKPRPSNDVLIKTEDVLDGNKLPTEKLQTVDREGCSIVDVQPEDD